MDLRSRLNAVLSSFAHPCASPVVQVDGQTACCVLVANAFMRRSQKVSGAQKHYEINRLLGAGVCTERELRSWMREFFPDMSERLWETCRRRADKFLQTGVKVFRWSTPKNFPAFEKQGREDFFSGPIDGEDITQSSTSPCPLSCTAKADLASNCPCLPYSIPGNRDSFLLIQTGSRRLHFFSAV